MSLAFNTIPTKSLTQTIDGSASVIQLSDILDWAGNNLAAADLGTTFYAVLRNSDNSAIEIMQLDGSTILNNDTTGITILKRGLGFNGDLTTQTTAYKLTWIKSQTTVEIGTVTPQLFQQLKSYIETIAILGAANATTSLQGLLQLATQAQVDAGTATGSTGASLAVTPNQIRAGNYNDYVADTGAADAYAIAPSPAITAYAAGQIFTFKATNANTTVSTLNVNGLGVKTIKKNTSTDLIANDILASSIVVVEYDGTNFQLISNVKFGSVVFGGNGSDGALNVTSGTTTINLGGAQIVTKNYTSINISNGATLAFSNPHANGTIIYLKSQGAVTIAGTLDASGMGAAGGAASSTGSGNVGSIGTGILENTAIYGAGGTAGGGGTAGVAFTYPSKSHYTKSAIQVITKSVRLYAGSSGGSGSGSTTGGTPSGTGGAGGNGGGGVYIECAGALIFSGTINVSGKNGAAGTGQGSGGGGGAAGSLVILANTITTNSGTVTATGGTGGANPANGASPTFPATGGGGAGAWTAAGGAGGAGLVGGNAAGAGAGGGGGGQTSAGNAGGSAGSTESGYIGLNTELF